MLLTLIVGVLMPGTTFTGAADVRLNPCCPSILIVWALTLSGAKPGAPDDAPLVDMLSAPFVKSSASVLLGAVSATGTVGDPLGNILTLLVALNIWEYMIELAEPAAPIFNVANPSVIVALNIA